MGVVIKAIEIFLEASFQEKIDIIAFSVVELLKYIWDGYIFPVFGFIGLGLFYLCILPMFFGFFGSAILNTARIMGGAY
jgi:hypothetical protein